LNRMIQENRMHLPHCIISLWKKDTLLTLLHLCGRFSNPFSRSENPAHLILFVHPSCNREKLDQKWYLRQEAHYIY
jgi:hypothetical protein